MNYRRISLYLFYLLPAIGIAGKVIGWATMTHNFFFDWVTEAFLLLFLLVEAPAIFRKFNPGVRMLRTASEEELLFQTPIKKGWLWIGIIQRTAGMVVCVLLSLMFLFFPSNYEFIFSGMALFFAAIYLAGIVNYLSHNPYRILVTEKGIHAYIYRYRAIPWEEIIGFKEKENWLIIRWKDHPDHDIDFEDLAQQKGQLLTVLKAQAKKWEIKYEDARAEYA